MLIVLACLAALAAGAFAKGHSSARLADWTEFDLNPQRSGSSPASTGITASNISTLRRLTVELPGTVDSSPLYLHAARIGGRVRSAVFVETTYGRVLALNPDDGTTLWSFTPRGYASWAGGYRVTPSTPLIAGAFIYAAAPDGDVHKIRIADGLEVRSAHWPARVSRDPLHEKLTPSLNIDGRYLIAATGGYIGDAPPYQGHVVLIDLSTGRVRAVFNALCANRRLELSPASRTAWGAAVLSRGGPVVEPGGRRLLVTTGNGPYDGRRAFGDAVLELAVPTLRLTQAFTPPQTRALDEEDLDLGSVAPSLLGSNRVLLGGKDHRLRLLRLSPLDGRRTVRGPWPTGGELQTVPFGGEVEGIFTQFAVVHSGSSTRVVATSVTECAVFTLAAGRLRLDWSIARGGTSPVYAGGLLYIYEPAYGGVYVYRLDSPRPVTVLPGGPGHWNSPIVVDGHVIEPDGNDNEHRTSGSLEIFSLPR